MERLERAAKEYRYAVRASSADAWKGILLAIVLLFVSSLLIWDGARLGDPSGAIILSTMLMLTVAFVHVALWHNIRAWMPSASSEGYVRDHRSYLDALLGRAPREHAWGEIAAVRADPYPVDFPVEELKSLPRALMIEEKLGKKWTLYRSASPAVFDKYRSELSARGLLAQPNHGTGPGAGAPGQGGP